MFQKSDLLQRYSWRACSITWPRKTPAHETSSVGQMLLASRGSHCQTAQAVGLQRQSHGYPTSTWLSYPVLHFSPQTGLDVTGLLPKSELCAQWFIWWMVPGNFREACAFMLASLGIDINYNRSVLSVLCVSSTMKWYRRTSVSSLHTKAV